MVSVEDYGEFETAWCPGCGNFGILKALKAALAGLDLAPHQVLLCSGIGQAAKTPHYLKGNVFNGLHGRSLPPAQGAKLSQPELTVVVNSGDGCNYGEGGNHFLAALRRNVNITLIAHDNQIYGLTKGQASPMTGEGHVTKAQPMGVMSSPFNPIAVAVGLKAGFVARGFSGNPDQLTDLIQQAVRHEGFSLVDVMQPCVSFNKVNTFAWYKERCKPLPDDYDPTNWSAAMDVSQRFGDEIPTGVIWKSDRQSFDQRHPVVQQGPRYKHTPDMAELKDIMMSYA